MKFSKTTSFNTIAAASMALMLSGCDSSDSSSSSTGSLSLSVTDAPVDMADNVYVEFSGVEAKPAEGKSITFDFTERCEDDPASCQIDLLALNSGSSEQILTDEEVPAGKYNWLRLMVKAEEGVKDSYIVIDGKEHELRIPSGAKTGLKLNHGFVVPAGGVGSFTVDFDLRKSVHEASAGDYVLRPTLRIVDNNETGTLSGSIDDSFFAGGDCTGAVYVFPAGTADAPDDEDGEGFGPDPITSALVENDGEYNYNVSFLAEGDYLVAFTCDAAADEPEVDNDTVSFLSEETISIIAGSDTVYDFLVSPL